MTFFIFPITEPDLRCFTEIFSVIPLLSEEHYSAVLQTANNWNEGLYTKLRFSPNIPHSYTDVIQECDIAIIPFKFDKNDERIPQYCSIANQYNKPAVCFYNDDNGELFDLPSNLFLFRTSITNTSKHPNERGFPVLIPDHFSFEKELSSNIENYMLTFCGFPGNNRMPILEQINNSYKHTNFQYRSSFFASEITSKLTAKKDFYKNLLSGSFTFCIRGNGNFSYRFYEALSFGRIPVLFNTDCVLPLSKTINWSKHIITINKEDISNIGDILLNANNKISPLANRKLWETHLSAEGYYNNFILDL